MFQLSEQLAGSFIVHSRLEHWALASELHCHFLWGFTWARRGAGRRYRADKGSVLFPNTRPKRATLLRLVNSRLKRKRRRRKRHGEATSRIVSVWGWSNVRDFAAWGCGFTSFLRIIGSYRPCKRIASLGWERTRNDSEGKVNSPENRGPGKNISTHLQGRKYGTHSVTMGAHVTLLLRHLRRDASCADACLLNVPRPSYRLQPHPRHAPALAFLNCRRTVAEKSIYK